MPSGTVICVHETRPQDLVGLKLLLLSIEEHCAGVHTRVTYAPYDEALMAWASDLSAVSLTVVEDANLSWNVKPELLVGLLDAGWEEVIWLDSDIILAADPRPLWTAAPDVLVAATEPPFRQQGSAVRTLGWGLEFGRALPSTVNSSVLRVTRSHRELLEAWRELLRTPRYEMFQRMSWDQRPKHFVGDQDALTALLGSAAFCDVPVRLLRNGRDVIQLSSPATYSVVQRLRNGRELAPIVHAQRIKPWRSPTVPALHTDPAGYYNKVHVELSPYLHVARTYRGRLDETSSWMDVRSSAGRVLRAISGGHVNYQGLPQAAVDRVIGGAYRPLLLGGD